MFRIQCVNSISISRRGRLFYKGTVFQVSFSPQAKRMANLYEEKIRQCAFSGCTLSCTIEGYDIHNAIGDVIDHCISGILISIKTQEAPAEIVNQIIAAAYEILLETAAEYMTTLHDEICRYKLRRTNRRKRASNE